MAFAIQTANGRYLNVIRWASHGTGGIGASGDGDYSQSKFPKEGRGRGAAPIVDIVLQKAPVTRTNNATYDDASDAEQDLQDAIKYIRSRMDRFKRKLAELEAENEELGGKRVSALGALDRLAKQGGQAVRSGEGIDLDRVIGRSGKLYKKLGAVQSKTLHNTETAKRILKLARVWRKVITGMGVVEV